MTTTVFSGFAIQFTFTGVDDDREDTNTGIAPIELAITSEGAFTPSYTYLPPEIEGEYDDEVEFDDLDVVYAAGLFIGGQVFDILNESPPNVFQGTYVAELAWSFMGQSGTTQILSEEYEVELTPTSGEGLVSIFVLGGDPLPPLLTVQDLETFAASIDPSRITSGPFAPDQPLDLSTVPGIEITEDDFFSGGDPDDLARLGDGDDDMAGNGGNDVLSGQDGNDTLNGGADNDTLLGGGDNDRMIGGGGDDDMRGGTGNDTMNGNVGDDLMLGGQGNDLMRGGSGEDDMNGQGGNDRMFGGRNNDDMSGGAGEDDLLGEHGNDLMSGDSGNDTMDGGDGRDTLNGGAGDDVLLGQDGRDRLVGNTGDDTLNGGGDNDVLRGGAGSDVFVFGFNHGQDRVADFTDDVDTLDITSGIYASVSDMLDDAQQIGSDVFLFTSGTSGASPDQVLIQNTTIAQLSDDIDLTSILI